jgi:hypothetical protein
LTAQDLSRLQVKCEVGGCSLNPDGPLGVLALLVGRFLRNVFHLYEPSARHLPRSDVTTCEMSVIHFVERNADYGQVTFLGFARFRGNLLDA